MITKMGLKSINIIYTYRHFSKEQDFKKSYGKLLLIDCSVSFPYYHVRTAQEIWMSSWKKMDSVEC